MKEEGRGTEDQKQGLRPIEVEGRAYGCWRLEVRGWRQKL